MTVGENIKRIRKERKLTQKQLGELCEPQISESTIRKYELGILKPKIETLKKISSALNCQISDIDESLYINRRIPYFANGLKELRIEHNLTQKQLAKEFHVKEKSIINWENGEREPYFHIVKKVADYFVTSLLYLYQGDKKYKRGIDANDIEATAREKAIESAPSFSSKNEIDYPISGEPFLCGPIKFTDASTSFEESQAREEAHNLIDSIPSEEPLSWEREKIVLQLRDILSTYSELNNAGREAAVKRIEELRYSDIMTDSRLDDIYFNRVKKKINKGEKLTPDEIEWWHNYLDTSVKTVGAIFESLFSLLNKEGRRKAHTQINRAIDQIEMLTKIPEYQKTPPEPPEE